MAVNFEVKLKNAPGCKPGAGELIKHLEIQYRLQFLPVYCRKLHK